MSWPTGPYPLHRLAGADPALRVAGVTRINPPEESRTYSSVWNDSPIGTGYARSMLDSVRCWIANEAEETDESSPWMQIDIGATETVAGVVVRGRAGSSQRVTRFTVQYSTDADDADGWTDAGNFTCDNCNSPISYSESLFPELVTARYIKILVQEWTGHVAMRAGVLTGWCPLPVCLSVVLHSTHPDVRYFSPTPCARRSCATELCVRRPGPPGAVLFEH